MLPAPSWRRSSHCTEQDLGTCVEVAPQGLRVAVRDSKDPSGPHLSISREDWQSFLDAIKSRSV
ncbi:DUF397 domain-containing protein [Nonomuraea sp. NPDC048826]|uniref:DUF397 domain-containing protein n=1 Tax=Nonomuraea sp. NPDC048826 TaxID=3364347 RepID=UPI0037107016